MKYTYLVIIFLLALSCSQSTKPTVSSDTEQKISHTSIVILGNVQDGGSPHVGCTKECCKNLFVNPDKNRKVVSLGVIDPIKQSTFLFEATPDLASQMKHLKRVSNSVNETLDGIFLTHAHIGHYAGLIYLGKEAMNADSIKVYVMPRMKSFLEKNGPWDQLVNTRNIVLSNIYSNEEINLTTNTN